MLQSVTQFVQGHPVLTGGLLLFAALGLIGLWYVVANYFDAIVTTLICIAGAMSGVVVFYRGIDGNYSDLVAIGGFLMVIFPVIFFQSIRTHKKIALKPSPGLANKIPIPGRPAS